MIQIKFEFAQSGQTAHTASRHLHWNEFELKKNRNELEANRIDQNDIEWAKLKNLIVKDEQLSHVYFRLMTVCEYGRLSISSPG